MEERTTNNRFHELITGWELNPYKYLQVELSFLDFLRNPHPL